MLPFRTFLIPAERILKSVRPSVCLSVYDNWKTSERAFMKFDNGDFHDNLSSQFNLSLHRIMLTATLS
jgi:hypothetical protein